MGERCAVCGRRITTVGISDHVITLKRTWTHYSRRANRTHHAISEWEAATDG